MFSSRFMLFPAFSSGGVNIFFYAVFNINKYNIEKFPFTYWLNGRWFLQIVDRDSGNLYPIYPLFPCFDFVSQMWGWLGEGGVVFFSYFMLFVTFLEKNWEIQKQIFVEKNNYFSFIVFMFFLCWKYCKVF